VLRIVRQHDNQGNYRRIALEDYFMDNPESNDVFMVSFMYNVQFGEETYLHNAR